MTSWVTKTTGRASGATALVDEPRHGALAGQVERQKRFVAQQDAGIAQQGLRDAQPLLLAAREQADGSVGVAGRTDGLRGRRPPASSWPGCAAGRPQRWPSDAEAHQVAAADGQRAVEGLLLGDVAQCVVAPAAAAAPFTCTVPADSGTSPSRP